MKFPTNDLNCTDGGGGGDIPTGPSSAVTACTIAICLIGCIVNVLVVISSGLILNGKHKPRTTYMVLGNIALSDSILDVLGLMRNFVDSSMCTCNIIVALIPVVSLISILSIVLIAIDRYIYLIHGMYYYAWVNVQRVKISIAIVWLLGTPILTFEIVTKPNFCAAPCSYLHNTKSVQNSIALTVLVLLIVIIFIYSKIMYNICAHTKRMERIESTIIVNALTIKWKAIKVVLLTSGGAFLTWGPGFVALLVANNADNKVRMAVLPHLPHLVLLMYGTTLVNPVIYAWWNKKFLHLAVQKFQNIFVVKS